MKRRRFLSSVAASAAAAAPFTLGNTVSAAERGRLYTVAAGQTIQGAIDRALVEGCHAESRALVVVKAGVYAEDLEVGAGVDLEMEDVVLRNTAPIHVADGASIEMRFCRFSVGSIDTINRVTP